MLSILSWVLAEVPVITNDYRESKQIGRSCKRDGRTNNPENLRLYQKLIGSGKSNPICVRGQGSFWPALNLNAWCNPTGQSLKPRDGGISAFSTVNWKRPGASEVTPPGIRKYMDSESILRLDIYGWMALRLSCPCCGVHSRVSVVTGVH